MIPIRVKTPTVEVNKVFQNSGNGRNKNTVAQASFSD
jgi:hypothetical protein